MWSARLGLAFVAFSAGACAASLEAPPPSVVCDALPSMRPVRHIAPPGRACPEGGVGTPEEWTPARPDARAEFAALGLTGGLVPRAEDYARLTADLGRIEQGWPEAWRVPYRGPYGSIIDLRVGEEIGRDMESGAYAAWGCLSSHYGIEEYAVRFSDYRPTASVAIALPVVLATELVSEEYARLPGVDSVYVSNITSLDGSGFCVVPDGYTWHYVFAVGSGDCPSGCIERDYRYITTTGTDVRDLGHWNRHDGLPRPCWMDICDPYNPYGLSR